MNEVNVVMISDERYIFPTSVALTSIISNKEENIHYKIYLICDRVSNESKEKIDSLKKGLVDIVYIDVSSEKYKQLEKSYSRVSSSSLMKFDIANYLTNVEKVIYLDGDIIATKGLLSLFNTNLGDNYAAVVRDGPKQFVAGGKKHSYYGDRNYFNSGMMLLNLKKIRQDGIPDKLIDFRLNQYNYFMDQDAFNRVFGGNVKYVGIENDFMLHLISYQNTNLSINQLNEFYDTDKYDNLDDLFKNVAIFHYTFGKPWKYYDVPFNEIWIQYYQKSPFSNKVLERKSIMTEMYNTKTYRIARILSQIFRTIFFFIDFDK